LKEGFLKASGPCDFWLLRERIIFFVDIKQFMREQPIKALNRTTIDFFIFSAKKRLMKKEIASFCISSELVSSYCYWKGKGSNGFFCFLGLFDSMEIATVLITFIKPDEGRRFLGIGF
jgi:hypothetical protein